MCHLSWARGDDSSTVVPFKGAEIFLMLPNSISGAYAYERDASNLYFQVVT